MTNHGRVEVSVQVRERFNLKLSVTTLQRCFGGRVIILILAELQCERKDRERISFVLYYGGPWCHTEWVNGMLVA